MSEDVDAVESAQDLRVAIGRVARRMRQLYAAHDTAGPTFTEVAVLSHLAREGPSSPTELAGRERVTSQAIAIVVRDLESRGMVARALDPSDGRRRVVTITAAGIAALQDRETAVMDRLIQTLAGHFDARDRQHLDAAVPLLHRIADNL